MSYSIEPSGTDGRLVNRRSFIGKTVGATAGLLASRYLSWAEEASSPATRSASTQSYKVGVCDWMILKRQKLGAFQLTKEIGADGVEGDRSEEHRSEFHALSLQ